MTRIAEALADAARRLAGAGKDDTRLDARLLLQYAGRLSHAELISRLGEELGADRLAAFEDLLARRIAGEPVHRIIGRRPFHGIELAVTPDVLDPRPETEVLVDRVLADLANGPLAVADVGTGSGAIALAILAARPQARCVAIDCSPAALGVARANAAATGLTERIAFVQADMLAGVDGTFDAIVSNPPYIPAADIEKLTPEVRLHDPRAALDGGADGLDAYRALLDQSAARLRSGGRLYLELGIGQAGPVRALADARGWTIVDVVADLAGVERVLVAAPAGPQP